MAGPGCPFPVEVIMDHGFHAPDLCMGTWLWAVHGPGTNERTAMDHGARNPEVKGQPSSHAMDHGEGGPTSDSAPTATLPVLVTGHNLLYRLAKAGFFDKPVYKLKQPWF